MKPTSTLLITTYNWEKALELVLLSVLKQSILPNAIVIADDGSDELTKNIIEKYNSLFSIKIQHIWQEDTGFNRTEILNKAIKAIQTDYIIQIDGDIILHKHFIKNHLANAEKNTFLYGSRISLNSAYSTKIIENKLPKVNLFNKGITKRLRGIYFPIFAQFITQKQTNNSSKLRGCNMSYWKKDALLINGYNEDYKGWGYEDYDFAQRLINAGVYSKRLKFSAIQFHLYHKEAAKGNTLKGDRILHKTIHQNVIQCQNGIKKL